MNPNIVSPAANAALVKARHALNLPAPASGLAAATTRAEILAMGKAMGLDFEEPGDPFEGMTVGRNTPRVVRPFAWVVPKKTAEVDDAGGYGWNPIGPPTRTSDDELWRAFVTHLGDTFADCLALGVYTFARPGAIINRGAGKRKWKVTALSCRKSVRRVYGDRLRVSQKLFGVRVMPDGWIWLVPKPVRLAFDLVKLASEVGMSIPERRRYGTEAAHFVYVHGPDGLATLKATRDLEGWQGLRSLLDTWWRL